MLDLIEYLRSLNQNSLILGVGNPLRGDDGFGPALIAGLHGKTMINLLDAEEIPEAFLDQAVQLAPDKLLIADAVALGGLPGEAALMPPESLGQKIAISTHNLPLLMFIKFFREQSPNTEVMLLGVQPKGIEFGKELSPEIRKTIDSLVNILTMA
ncbi:MAG: hydrogenase maturation protease [bacterium]|nr:hydrogenase maturation protease [bacterium]